MQTPTVIKTRTRRAAAVLLLCGFPSVVTAASDKSTDAAIVDYAIALVGVPYRSGGTTPEQGFDCSGFVRHVFRTAGGIELPRTARDIARAGDNVAWNELKPGDLVFYNTLGQSFSHVGIYVGDGQFVHAPKRGHAVKVVDISGAYWTKRFNGVRRVLDERRVARGSDILDRSVHRIARGGSRDVVVRERDVVVRVNEQHHPHRHKHKRHEHRYDDDDD